MRNDDAWNKTSAVGWTPVTIPVRDFASYQYIGCFLTFALCWSIMSELPTNASPLRPSSVLLTVLTLTKRSR